MQKEELKSGLTMKVIVIGVLMVIIEPLFFNQAIMMATNALGYEIEGQEMAESLQVMAWVGQAFLMLFVVTMINRWKKVFTKQEIGMTLIMTIIPLIWVIWGFSSGPLILWNILFAYQLGSSDYALVYRLLAGKSPLWPAELVPYDANYWKAVITGSLSKGNAMPINLSYFTTLGTLNYLWWTLPFIGGVFISLLLLRLHVEIEALPFTMADVITSSMREAEGWETWGKKITNKMEKIVFNKGFIVAFILSFLLYLTFLIGRLKWLFTGYGWTSPATGDRLFDNPDWPMYYDLAKLGIAILPFVPTVIDFSPYQYAFAYILPMDVLLGFFVGFVAFWFVYAQIAMALGRYPAWQPGYISNTGYYGLFGFPGAYGGGYGNFGWFYAGMLIAFAIVPLIRYRAVFGPIFKTILGGKVSEDVDPDPVIPYKYAWWGFIAIWVAYLGVCLWLQMPLWQTLVYNILMIIIAIAVVRIFSECGGWLGSCGVLRYFQGFAVYNLILNTILLYWLYPEIKAAGADPMTPGTIAFFLLHTRRWGGRAYLSWFKAIIGSLVCFFIAKYSKIKKRDVFIALIVFGAILTPLTDGLWEIVGLYWNTAPAPYIAYRLTSYVTPNLPNFAVFGGNPLYYGAGECFGLAAAGFIVIAVAYWLRAKYKRFTIHPVGIFLGAFVGFAWVTFVVAYVLKYLTLRAGGPTLYERTKLIALGCLVAICVWLIVDNFLYVLYAWQTALGLWQ